MAIEESPNDTILLPWWRNPLTIALIAFILLLTAGAVGYRAGSNSGALSHNTVDTGFLQDMRIHHEQAVAISSLYLAVAPDGNLTLRTIAGEIMRDQSMETGRMVQLLRLFSEAETNETEQAMSWMGTPVPLAKMLGYATDAELTQLSKSTGGAADTLFAKLMIAHHLGGIHMAEYASANAINSEVRAFSDSILISQQGEINEMKKIAQL